MTTVRVHTQDDTGPNHQIEYPNATYVLDASTEVLCIFQAGDMVAEYAMGRYDSVEEV